LKKGAFFWSVLRHFLISTIDTYKLRRWVEETHTCGFTNRKNPLFKKILMLTAFLADDS